MRIHQTSNQRVQRRITNMALLFMTAGAMLAAGQVKGQVASPLSIDINDLLDGPPTVTLSPGLLTAARVDIAFEQATVVFQNFLHLPAGSTSLILTEPSADPFGPRDSDYATVTANADLVTVFFASDGAPDYSKNFPPAGTVTADETGNPQFVLNGDLLKVTITSDLNTQEVPDSTSTIGCFSLALMALGCFGRRVGLYRFRV